MQAVQVYMNKQLPHHFPGGRNKAVTLSYDDGTIHDRQLVSLLDTYGIRASFHLNSGKLGTHGYLRPDEIRSLYDGHEIASHSATHPNLCEFDEPMIVREVIEDVEKLTELAARPVRGFSYPYGAYNDYVAEILAKIGIVYARTVQSTFQFSLPQNFMQWHPTCHHEDNLVELARSFINMEIPAGACAVLYVWGHSYEFHDRDNWDIMREFCKEIAKDSSIWPATSIELYDHVTTAR